MIDLCVGKGTALQFETDDAPIRRYGIELMPNARILRSKGIEIVQGNSFDAIAKPESARTVENQLQPAV